jgi:hypothetical protein
MGAKTPKNGGRKDGKDSGAMRKGAEEADAVGRSSLYRTSGRVFSGAYRGIFPRPRRQVQDEVLQHLQKLQKECH